MQIPFTTIEFRMTGRAKLPIRLTMDLLKDQRIVMRLRFEWRGW